MDGAGNSGPLSEELVIPNLPPMAMITSTKFVTDNISTGETIFLSSQDSFDPDGEITSYFWNFGDGTFSYRPWVYHTYRYPQKYNLSLTVYDDFGNHKLTLIVINVTDPRVNDTDGEGGPGINDTAGTENAPAGENETNGTQGDEDDGKKNNIPILEIIMKSKISYVLLGTLFVFILLFGTVFISRFILRRQEQVRFSRYNSIGPRINSVKNGFVEPPPAHIPKKHQKKEGAASERTSKSSKNSPKKGGGNNERKLVPIRKKKN